jgi:hypothetical protein
MIAFRFRYFARDGRFAQGGESYATFLCNQAAMEAGWDGRVVLEPSSW